MAEEDRPGRKRTLRWVGALVAIVVVVLLGAAGLLAALFWPTLADELYVERYRDFDPSGSYAYTDADLSRRLVGLEFESPATDSSIAEGFEVLTRLERLDLPHTQVDDSLGPALRRLPALEYLDLSDTNVTDAIVDDLLDHPELRYIDLYRTKVTPEAARRLRDALWHNYPANAALRYDWDRGGDE